jgi:hypothetical protein
MLVENNYSSSQFMTILSHSSDFQTQCLRDDCFTSASRHDASCPARIRQLDWKALVTKRLRSSGPSL